MNGVPFCEQLYVSNVTEILVCINVVKEICSFTLLKPLQSFTIKSFFAVRTKYNSRVLDVFFFIATISIFD